MFQQIDGRLPLVALLVASAPAAASALCGPLLELTAPGEPSLVLNSCEATVSAPSVRFGTEPALAFELNENALARWRAALQLRAEGTGLGGHLLLGNTRIRPPHGSSLPAGQVVNSYSARRLDNPSWRWDSARGLNLYLDPQPTVFSGACRQLAAPGVNGRAVPLVMWIGTRDVEPGEVLAPGVFMTTHPADFRPVDASCLGRWSTADAGKVLQPHPHLGVFQLAADARPGEVYTLQVTVGERRVEGKVQVIDPQLRPLVGRWRQVSETPCAEGAAPVKPAHPVRELMLDGKGRFTLTWEPFEAKVDVTGSYRVVPGPSPRIEMTVTGGDERGTARTGTGVLTGDGTLDFPEWKVGVHPKLDLRAVPSACGARFGR